MQNTPCELRDGSIPARSQGYPRRRGGDRGPGSQTGNTGVPEDRGNDQRLRIKIKIISTKKSLEWIRKKMPAGAGA